jgi:hypothetical protein
LVLKIFTLVSDVSVRFLQQQDCFTTPFRLPVQAAVPYIPAVKREVLRHHG